MSFGIQSHKVSGRAVLFALLIIVTSVSAVFVIYVNTGAASVTPEASRQINTLKDLNQAYVDIADQVRPAVVTVSTERVMYAPKTPFGGDFPFLDFFFGRPNRPGEQQQREYHQRGLGSGVIIKPDGLILTNNHVVDDADSIYVRAYDGDRYTATVVGVDPQTDVAVIRIPADNLPYIEVANSDDLKVGEIVLAVGSPMSENLAYTVTQGIVSATGRSNVGLADYEDFIQTDAAINPGNSGGPLVNLDGKLVGINTAIVSQSGGFQGIGFAVPSNMAMQVMNSLVNEGKVVRGWLGVSIQDVNENISNAMGLDNSSGALVGDVVPGSPAEKAHMKAGDLIVAVDDYDIENASQLRNRIAETKPNTNVMITVLRDGRRESLDVTLGEKPEQLAQASNEDELDQLLGFKTSDLSPALAEQSDVPLDAPGVIVTDIDPYSSAYQAGLRTGDLIRELNKKPVENESEFTADAGDLHSGSNILLRIQRQESAFYLAFRV